MVGFSVAQRYGAESRGDGVAFVEAVGSWLQYMRLVNHGPMPAESLAMPNVDDLLSLGKLCGWVAAGDGRALAAVEELNVETRELATSIIETVSEMRLAAPIHLLDSTSQETSGS